MFSFKQLTSLNRRPETLRNHYYAPYTIPLHSARPQYQPEINYDIPFHLPHNWLSFEPKFFWKEMKNSSNLAFNKRLFNLIDKLKKRLLLLLEIEWNKCSRPHTAIPNENIKVIIFWLNISVCRQSKHMLSFRFRVFFSSIIGSNWIKSHTKQWKQGTHIESHLN